MPREALGESIGSRRLCTSRLHSRRLDEAASWFHARPALEEILLVADRRRAADELMRQLALAGGGRLGVRATTSRQLAAELVLAAGGSTPLSSLGAEAVVARALDRSRLEGGRLEFFEPVREAPGFLPALVSTLDDLRLAEISPDRLEVLGERGRDLARLLTAYTSELGAFGLADTATLLDEAMTNYRGRDPAPYSSILWLDPQVTSALEARWLGVLAAGASEVLALVPAADSETIHHFERELGIEAFALPSAADPLPSSRLGRGRTFLFERDLPGGPAATSGSGSGNSDTEESLAFFSAPGEGQEAVEIARRIHQLARQGVAFERMAILLRNPTLYQPLVEAALDRGGIPAYYSRGVLRPDPTGRALLALLDCATEGLSAHRFAEYLSFGQVPNATDEGRPPTPEVPWVDVEIEGADDGGTGPESPESEAASDRSSGAQGVPGSAQQLSFDFDAPTRVPVVAGSLSAPSHWEQLLVEAAVVEGEDRWRRRLAGLEAEMRRQLEASEEEGDGRAHIELSLLRLQHLERFALPLIDELSRWPTASTWEEWLRRLESLAVRALRRPERVLQVLAELRPMAEVGGVGLGEVRRVLAARLTDLRGGSEGRCYGKVFVAPIEEARGRSFETVFLPGLAEGVFPRAHFEDPLLLDADRRRLSEALATRDTLVARERLLAGLAIGAAEERLVASYPTLDAIQERARVPSFYALDLLRAADGSLPDQRSLERRAAESSALRQGWPAPRDAAVAIDATEFDLAVVEPLLRAMEIPSQVDAVRGRASYLLDVSDRLARSLRARGRRWRNTFSVADGLVASGEVMSPQLAAALAERRLDRRPYSPTALQSWAACPYRFHLQGLMRLRPRDEAVRLERLDPRTRGSLFHQVQAETLRELARLESLPVSESNLTAALEVVDRRLDAVALASEEELVPALPGVWRSEIESLRVDLRGWLRDVALRAEGWTPRYFELAFGLPLRSDRDPSSVAEPVAILGRFAVRGAIDLVEVDPATERLRVTDHKTGRPPEAKEVAVGGGEILQPLIYALAVQEILEGSAQSGRLYYSSRRGAYETREVPVSQYHVKYLEDVLTAVDEAVEAGFLPAAPREKACDYCDFRPICGPYEELRTSRKRRDPLATLDKVRTYQ